jgi:CRP-like cAMP-binding protein
LEQRAQQYLRKIAAIGGIDRIIISHADLAEDLGVSRIELSPVMKELEKERSVASGKE